MLKRLTDRRTAVAGAGLLIVAVAALVWWMISHPADRRDLAWARLQSEGDIRIGLDPSYPPFEFEEEVTGDIEGYDLDLAREIARRLGVQATFVHVGFDSLYDTLRSGKVDVIISAMPYDPTWTENVSYGVWYFNAGQFLAVRADETSISAVTDLAGRRLAVELGTSGDLEARRLQRQIFNLTVQTFGSAEEALNGLVTGGADAALVDAVSAYLYIAKGAPIRLIGDAVLDESYAVVTERRSTQLRAAIDQKIVEMKVDGFLDLLRDKWLLGSPAG